jgi:hypothetical protein
VGAPGADLPGDRDLPEGDVYVFLPTRTGWVQSQRLNDPERPFFVFFGSQVALGDGLLAVSAPINEGTTRAVGRVIVFDRVGDEFKFGRVVTQIEGRAGIDLDFSRRTLIASMVPSTGCCDGRRAIGHASIIKFGRGSPKRHE